MDTFEEHENAYTGLLDEDTGEVGHWAFGTGFDDPLAGVDSAVPDGVDRTRLAETCVALADDALIHAQRLAEWIAHGPEVEEEIAMANIGLDLIGQARMLYVRATQATPHLTAGLPAEPVSPEDALAYFRDADDFHNVCLAELPRADFAFTIARLFALSSRRLGSMQELSAHADPVLAAISVRATKELDYHREHAARWCLTLAHGTDESRRRIEAAFAELGPWLAELGELPEADWAALERATGLLRPPLSASSYDGRSGRHTHHLAPLLATMQEIARAHPEGSW